MKLFLSLCAAAVGVVGFASTEAKAAEAPATTAPATVWTASSSVHMAPTVVVETHRRHWHRRYHRRYYWRHHRRYYY